MTERGGIIKGDQEEVTMRQEVNQECGILPDCLLLYKNHPKTL